MHLVYKYKQCSAVRGVEPAKSITRLEVEVKKSSGKSAEGATSSKAGYSHERHYTVHHIHAKEQP